MQYRFYLLSLAGKTQAAHEVYCDDDAMALTRARRLFKGNEFEIWHQARRIYPSGPPNSPAETGQARTFRDDLNEIGQAHTAPRSGFSHGRSHWTGGID
jgi:hypothetical protein